MMYYIFYIALL